MNCPLSKSAAVLCCFIFFVLCIPPEYTEAGKGENPKPEDKFSFYKFLLSPEMKTDRPAPGCYSRREIESFLCAAAPEFISLADVYIEHSFIIPANVGEERWYVKRKNVFSRYFIKHKTVDQKQRTRLDESEINKWFEEKITLVCKGGPTPGDIDTIEHFLDVVNDSAGRELIVFSKTSGVGNLIVEFSNTPAPSNPMNFIGESVCLQDDLRVVYYRENDQMKIETYKTRFDNAAGSALFVKYTPEEKEFGKENRVLKIYISNIEDRKSRDMVIIHELFHALGFCGHSPCVDSNLFPLPIPVGDLRNASGASALGEKVRISKLARRMIEMLYRPEITPGMSLKEAGEILSRLKYREETSPPEIRAFLAERKEMLEKQKNELLEIGKPRLLRREEIAKLLFKVDDKMERLEKEVKKENHLAPELIKDKRLSLVLGLNIGIVKAKLKRLEAAALELNDGKENLKKRQTLERQISLRKEDVQVLEEILGEVRECEDQIRRLKPEEAALDFEDIALNKKLRRVVRQLAAVDTETERL
jgi:hypothetical protein